MGVAGTSGTATGGMGVASTGGTSTGGMGVAGTGGTSTGGMGVAGTGGTSTGGMGVAGTGGTATGGMGVAGTGGTATGGMGVAGTGGTATGGMGVAGTGGTATGGMGVAGTSGAATGGVAGGVSVGGSAGTAGANTGGVATGGAPGGAGAGTGGALGGSAGVAGNGGSGGIRIMTETEPNDSWSLYNDLGYGSVIVLAALQGTDPDDPGQDTETFRFTLTAPRSDVEIRAFSGSPPSTSCDGLHLRFDLYKSTDTSNYYAEDVHNDIGTCTALAWQTEPLMRGLPAGQYYLRLTINAYSPDPVPAYYVQLLIASECGDGRVSGSEQCDSTDATRCDPTTCQKIPLCGDREIIRPEMCDDGNTTDGDGCSSTCQREGTPDVEVNDTIDGCRCASHRRQHRDPGRLLLGG